MKKGRVPRSHSNPLVRLGIYVFAAYIAVSLITLQMQINQKKLELKEIEAQSKAAYQQQEELRRQLELGDDGEHIRMNMSTGMFQVPNQLEILRRQRY